uniref:Uncharacterized protein n=1 Tax=Zonotrichia albicollis TaxID=44394 RepID=A0A8D2MAD4_ZONAL
VVYYLESPMVFLIETKKLNSVLKTAAGDALIFISTPNQEPQSIWLLNYTKEVYVRFHQGKQFRMIRICQNSSSQRPGPPLTQQASKKFIRTKVA